MKTLRILGFLLLAAWTGQSAGAGMFSYGLEQRGISRLEYNGQVLTDQDSMTIEYVMFQRPDGTTYTENGWESVQWLPRTGDTVVAKQPWGRVSCTYTQVGDGVQMDLSIHNATTNRLTWSEIRLQNLWLQQLDKAKYWRFHVDMCWANDGPDQGGHPFGSELGIPLVQCDYATGCVAFAQSAFPDPASEPGGRDVVVTFQAPAGYPLFCKLNMGGIAPGQTKTRQFTLRFAPAGTDPYAPDNYLHDLFEKYNAAHPMLVQWDDRRPIIQQVFLANGIPATPQNPRCYQTHQDLRTEDGKAAFRAELMRHADTTIEVLKKANAQGIVYWSIEGIEGVNVMYGGDPTRVSLAPEMEYKDASGVATVDALLKRYTDAGFRVGHCLRPQELRGTPPAHHEVADTARVLIDKIRYCQKRWGSTLFYVDSTVRLNGQSRWEVLDGSVYKWVREACPDVLVMPENQGADTYSHAVPYDEGGHHLVYRTPRKVSAIWPGAFTAIHFDPTLNFTSNVIPRYVEAVRQGNILFFQPWEQNTEMVAAIYREAGSPPTARITDPVHPAAFDAGATIPITVRATDADGTIAKVEFYAATVEAGRVKLGEATAAPYQFSWQDVPPGRYVLSVRVQDNAGLERWPASVVVTVGGRK